MGTKLPDELDSPAQAFFDSICRASQRAENQAWGVTTIGQVIAWLEPVKPDVSVMLDFGGLVPSGLHSWRGNYADLAIGFSIDGEVTAGMLLALLRSGIGKVFTGWKGGDYLMDADTPLYIDNEGRYSGKCWISAVEHSDYLCTLITKREESE